MNAEDLFAIPENFPFPSYFKSGHTPWSWIPQIGQALESPDFVSHVSTPVDLPSGTVVLGQVFLHPTVKLSPNVVIHGPAFIGAGSELRPGVFIRGNVIVGEGCILGNSCEFKESLLLNRVETPHFNYVGNSVLGNGAHLAAGVICSNLRLDRQEVWVSLPVGKVNSGLRKLGALVGDGAEVGCNTVLNPGTILGKRSLVYPGMAFGGFLEPETVAGAKTEILRVNRR